MHPLNKWPYPSTRLQISRAHSGYEVTNVNVHLEYTLYYTKNSHPLQSLTETVDACLLSCELTEPAQGYLAFTNPLLNIHYTVRAAACHSLQHTTPHYPNMHLTSIQLTAPHIWHDPQ